MENQSSPVSQENIPNQSNSHSSLSPENKSKSASDENNGKWSDIQHSKYIVFMERHRDQFKSKQRRRAHKFYKNMSAFIKTRNALQCRSHHQKLQERYCYSNKIILAYKQHADMSIYEQAQAELKIFENQKAPKTQSQIPIPPQNAQAQSQTEISGIHQQYIVFNPELMKPAELMTMSSIPGTFGGSQYLTPTFGTFPQGVYYPYYPYPQFYNHFS